MTKYIKAKVTYVNLEGGFWGLIDDSGKNLYPINFPDQLKHEGKLIKCGIIESDIITMTMWGDPIEIVSFETIAF